MRPSVRSAVRQRQNSLTLRAVIEGMKPSDFVEPAHAIERIEITAAQVWIPKCLRALPGEKMKAQPAAVSARNSLGFSKKCDKQKQNKIRIYLRLELKIARKIFRCDFARSTFELKRRVQRVVEFLHKHDQRPDISIAYPCARIVLFELFNQPARIVNTHV